MDWDCRLLEVLVSQITVRTLVLYEIADGGWEDPATNVERRCAWFVGPWEKDLRTEVAAAMPTSSWEYYEGLKDAISDEIIEYSQEADEMAEKHRRESELLTNPGRAGYQGSSTSRDQELYEGFLNALDVLSTNEEDENAWAKVDAWRNRIAMRYEK